MTAVSFRMQQCAISFIGTLLFLPVYLFWGGLFSFSFTLLDSVWAWGFGLTACWFQILAILFSFVEQRKAACWMLVNTAISFLMTVGYLAEAAHSPTKALNMIELWPYSHSSFWKTGLTFWALPLFFALLLLRRDPCVRKKKRPVHASA
jgi:hypothetical protein